MHDHASPSEKISSDKAHRVARHLFSLGRSPQVKVTVQSESFTIHLPAQRNFAFLQDARGASAKYGLSDAITRANLYMEVGADCSLVQGPRSTYELQTVANHTTGHRAVSISEGGLTPSHSYQQLKEMGFNLVRSAADLVQLLICIALYHSSG